jgi:virulence-associated protein VapD
MSQYEKLLLSVLRGNQDNNISFSDLRKLIINLGFYERIKGDHYIYTKKGIDEILNLQPRMGMAKPYQVKQIRNVILKYRLGDDINA